ncbi:MAG: hypothetical protein ACJ74R_14625 [Gaiellaceae bacterium]
MRRVRFLVLAAVLCLSAWGAASASAGPPLNGILVGDGSGQTTYLSRCSLLRKEQTIWSCYVSRLLADVEKSHDPANELPRIDKKVRKGGGFLQSSCHMMMHEVGRKYARRHNITLANLQKYLPRSNDPGCSAGFGMGMVLTLGAEIGRLGPDGAIKLCMRAPTRFRSYTCVHTLGHAYMRLYHEQLPFAVRACRAVPVAQAPDCAQGAYHDYWLSLSGADATRQQRKAVKTARVLCASAIPAFVRPCWFRYFLERPPQALPTNAAGVRRLCAGLSGRQRGGCIGAAALITSADPFIQMRICARLRGADAISCLYGMNVQNLAEARGSQRVRLIQACGDLRRSAQGACYEWLGTTLSVVTNSRFRTLGCPFIAPTGRSACLAGAKRMNQALVTFS